MRLGLASGALTLVLVAAWPQQTSGYSVLSHEAAIDAVWDSTLRPMLLRRYPATTTEGLNRARSYAYGGSVIHDLGYYPFGSKFFSNLLHYVRSGDFVETLVASARDVDEYAFALGAMAHYINDCTGHPHAVNLAVPEIYPKLKAKYGDEVTYIEARKEHVIVEFSFDIVQVAGGKYLPDAYRQFIGFRVATPLLERAFKTTYGLSLDDLFVDKEQAIASFRYAVSQIVPAITEAAWRDKQDEIAALTPGIARADFVFAYNRVDYERDYGGNFQKPGLFARFLAFVYRLVPKIGPLKPLSFKTPTPDSQALFADSFRLAASRYRAALNDAADRRFNLTNTDFDTGKQAAYGEYRLADETYAELLKELRRRKFDDVSEPLRANIRRFYGSKPEARDRKAQKELTRTLRDLEAMPE